MGRGRRKDGPAANAARGSALSDSERDRRYPALGLASASLSEAELAEAEAPARTQHALKSLRADLSVRIQAELSCQGQESLGELLVDHENPLQHFIDYIVYAECDSRGVGVFMIVQEPGSEDMQGSATILADYGGAQQAPVLAMVVDADLSHYAGAQGAEALAEEFYRAIAQVAASESTALDWPALA
jgi:hypothetical protein